MFIGFQAHMTTPKISVILSCYNSSLHLKKSIESILSQTFKDFEFIIINDGSSDNTLQIIQSYASKDERIFFVNQENIGLTKSLNKAIKLSKGKYIARIDADDFSYKDRLIKQYTYLEQNQDIVLLGGQRIINDKINNKIFKDKLPLTTEEIRKRAIISNPFFHSLVIFRREIVEKIGDYNEGFKYVQDYEFWSRIIYDYKTENSEEVLGEKIVEKNAISFRDDISMERNLFVLKAKYKHFKNGSYPLTSFSNFIKPLYRVFKSIPFYYKYR
jgi:glycosyltransferase involved in cell wall biosynthesis